MILTILTYIIIGLFVLLWAHTGIPKLFNIARFRKTLKTQYMPAWLKPMFAWLIPLSETAATILLLLPSTALIGMYLSLALIGVFTIYVGGIYFNMYDKYPCPCGGIFTKMGWKKHFKVNIMLTLTAAIGILLMELGY
ncbi:MauE/DoxX family redox-associated membrane protein [Pararcticibacter amylolyticus]|uniref:Methylamine utilisation protein MauE domain-containing protein n=1 Tax=Pararcticibacter amylolyticus TaxID=2173175 RepID=A0A2U2PFR8_9SPHI|nr:MauE/DoxX family redox-associated membrane protein [Pararcticibacter amylolyticus]PWG80223.1 hypothetical protein DDR33_13600 [Pararcticibacter amylolyticus]